MEFSEGPSQILEELINLRLKCNFLSKFGPSHPVLQYVVATPVNIISKTFGMQKAFLGTDYHQMVANQTKLCMVLLIPNVHVHINTCGP